MCRSQVGSLAKVVSQVEQFWLPAPIPVDQFPITKPYGAAWPAPLIAPVGIVPQQRPLAILRGRVFDCGQKGDAVSMLRGKQRNTNAPLVQPSLARAERQV